jgi:hypothetical protein
MTSFLSATTLVFAGFGICASLSAATVGAGTFNLGGTAVGTTLGINFYFSSPGDQTASILLPTTGAFASLTPGTQVVIQNLAAPTVIPGGSFDFMNWIQLSNNINLDLDSLPIPVFPICSSNSPETVGYQCLVNASSPVVLTKTVNGVAARVNLSGEAHFAGNTTDFTPYQGLLTAPSTSFTTIADFESYYSTFGAIPAISYSASFTTTAVPEPTALALAGIGFLGVGVLIRRRSAKNHAAL